MSLHDDPIIQDIGHRINNRIRALADTLASGAAGNYESYKQYCGEIRGLKNALTLIDESIKNYANDDDD